MEVVLDLATLVIRSVHDESPPQGMHVLAWHRDGIDRAARYGEVWRLADYGEDELHEVTRWAMLPRRTPE